MKKLAIAGASLALAAMPVVGVFADGANYTDQINVTIANNCAFSRGATSHASGSWTTDTTDSSLDKLSAVTLAPGSESTIASSNYKVICNNTTGSQVTVSATALTGTTTATNTMTYNATTAGVSGTWRLASGGTGADVAQNRVYYYAGTTTTDGETFTVTYYGYPASNQQADTYQGTAAYTFAQL